MKYTRYNHKNKQDKGFVKFIISMVLGTVFAGLIGFVLAKVIFGIIPVNNVNSSTLKQDVKGDLIDESVNEIVNGTNFHLIQCGYFTKEENAKEVLDKITRGGFINEEDGKFRVVAGVYGSDYSEEALANLKNDGVESIKVNITLNKDNVVQNQIAEISDGYIKILNETFDDNVKYVDTKDFKSWVLSLEEVKNDKDIEVLNKLKDYIKKLPEQIKRENVTNEMKYLYNILINYK